MTFKKCESIYVNYNLEHWEDALSLIDKEKILIAKVDIDILYNKNMPHLSQILKTMLELKIQELVEELASNQKFLNTIG